MTTRLEDKAYCLMGIFDVFMPLIYGEGDMAFQRLKREIAKKANTSTQVRSQRDTSGSPNNKVRSLNNKITETLTGLFYDTLGVGGSRLLNLDPGTMGENMVGHVQLHDLTAPPTYYALSYVWGQEPSIHLTVIDGRKCFIQPNLFQALQRVRLESGTYSVWVDSICINQRDTLERNMQVRQMAKIYRNASGVLIWLGEGDFASKIALKFISKITSDQFRWGNTWWEEYGFTALAQVLEREWFRRGWVLQEAAFAENSIIHCGDQEIYMDHFITAMRAIRDRLSNVTLRSNQVPAKFSDSPAIGLMDIVTGALKKHPKGDDPRRTMALADLVCRTTYCETTDPRDAIYALLNLANDVFAFPGSDLSDLMDPDYSKSVPGVFADFILHCSLRSKQLDIICRPWAPVIKPQLMNVDSTNRFRNELRNYPSWIMTRDKLPFGDPAWRSKRRLYGDALVSRNRLRCYFAHYGSVPKVTICKSEDGVCDGSLSAQGLILGEIVRISTRMADAIVTKECIDTLRVTTCEDNILDKVWRTLCADRGEKGERAPYHFEAAMMYLLELSSGSSGSHDVPALLDQMSSIDPEELLDSDLPDYVEQFLKVVREIVWNRRTFRLRIGDGSDRTLVGLVPQHAKVNDQVCVLYGCSVPVVLRKINGPLDEVGWHLVGDAYVHGVMDGEAISSQSLQTTQPLPKTFKTW